MAISPKQFKKWRELCKEATPGPWSIWTSNSIRRITGADGRDGGVLSAVSGYNGRSPDLHGHNRELDLAFIASARTALPACLDEIERLQAENERMQSVLDVATKWRNYVDMSQATPRVEMLAIAIDKWIINKNETHE